MTQRFGIDVPALGLATAATASGLDVLGLPAEWLLAVEDPERMLGDLEANRSRLGIGSVVLQSCKFKRAHLDDSTWSTLHRLTVRDNDEADAREVDLRGHLVPPSCDAPVMPAWGEASRPWQGYLPDLRLQIKPEPADVALLALPELTEGTLAAPILEAALRARGGAFSEIRLSGCTPQVMRYREGRRCTIRFDLHYGPGPRLVEWPDAVIAKVYAGDEARHTYTAMTELWDSPLGRSTTVAVAEPLAIVHDHNLLLQRVVPGDHTLKSAIAESFAGGASAGVVALSPVVHRAGRGLAELHTCGVTSGPPVTWAAQLAALGAAADELISAMPHLDGALRHLLTGLDAVARTRPSEPRVPTHRSFRAAQILLGGPDPAFLDFDGFCQAEPGLDLALFRTTLCDLALRAITHDDTAPLTAAQLEDSMERLDGLCATFLEGYEEVATVNRARLALWDALTSARAVVDCWRKVKFEYLDRRVEFLRRSLGHDSCPP